MTQIFPSDQPDFTWRFREIGLCGDPEGRSSIDVLSPRLDETKTPSILIVCFRGRKFHLLPGSGALAHMIRVQTCEGFTHVAADKLILELLSALAWAEQAEAVRRLATGALLRSTWAKGRIGDGLFDQ